MIEWSRVDTGPVIDLDLVPEPPNPVVRRRALRWYRVWLALAALVPAALLSAAALPAPDRFPAMVRLPAGGQEYALTDEAIYVATATRSQLTRYTMDGTARWTVPVFNVYTPTLLTVGSTVLVGTDGWPGDTYAIDRETGRIRWHTQGRVVATTATTAVLNGNSPDYRPGETGFELTALSLADGSPLWQRSMEPSETEQLVRALTDGRGGYVVTGAGLVDAEGLGEFIDLASGVGKSLSGFAVSWGGSDRAVAQFGPVLLALGPGKQSESTLRAFAADTFRQVWSVELAGDRWGNACGRWLCVPDGDGTRALDPATGAQQWRVDWNEVRADPGSRRGIAFTAGTRTQPGRTGVLDLATGRTLRTFPGWRSTVLVGDRWTPLMREAGGDHWDIAALDLTRLTTYKLGEFPTAYAGRCQVSSHYVACPVLDRKIGVWRYSA